MVLPYCSFHCQTRLRNSSRPRSQRDFFSLLRSSFSTTVWVAMPAWSVPAIQRTSNPSIRFTRARMSWRGLLGAWPMWSAPVTLGGGMTIVNGSRPEAGSAVKSPACSQCL
jgi:hypothetical protein